MIHDATHRALQVMLCLALGFVAVACGPDEEPAVVEPESIGDRLAEAAALASQLELLLEESGAPGIAVALAEGDDEPLVAAAGLADIEQGVPLRPDTPFFIGSISKNLFAVVALQLPPRQTRSTEREVFTQSGSVAVGFELDSSS